MVMRMDKQLRLNAGGGDAQYIVKAPAVCSKMKI